MINHPSKDILNSKGTCLKGKIICVCVTGSVAIINSVNICRELMRFGAEVYVVMSKNAEKLISPDIFHWATGNRVITKITGNVEHILLAGERPGKIGKADLILVAPATANTISKIAHGIDDTSVTTVVTTAIGSGTPIIIVPAMHESMYKHPILLENIEKLKNLGIEFILPVIEENKAKMAPNSFIVNFIIEKLTITKDLKNKRFLITTGPGREFIDRIRFISNPSSGKMGVELAKEIKARGGDVTLIYGKGSTAELPFNLKCISVDSAQDFLNIVKNELNNQKYDVFISAAAIPDFTPTEKVENKISSTVNELTIKLKPTPKIIEEVRKISKDIFIVAFKAESNLTSEELIKKAYLRMKQAGSNMIIANDVYNNPNAGFQSEKNEVYIIKEKDNNINVQHVELSSKREVANKIINSIIEEFQNKK